MSDRLALALAELVDAIRAEVAAEVRPDVPDRLLSLDEAAAALGIGRSRLYAEMDAGRLRSLKAGRRRLVPASAIADFAHSSGPFDGPGALPVGGGVRGTTLGAGRRRSGTGR